MNNAMIIPKVNLALRSALFLLLSTASSATAQGVLIGPSTRNGSFEDGDLPPWMLVANATTVVQDAALSSHGEWLAVLSQTASSSIARPGTSQLLSVDSAQGRSFSLTFDAGNGTAGFDGVRVFFTVRNISGMLVLADNLLFQLPSFSPGELESYQRNWSLPSAWDGGQLSLGLQFEKANAVAGMTYFGYLDNVILTQIPEPSTFALLVLGGFMMHVSVLVGIDKRVGDGGR